METDFLSCEAFVVLIVGNIDSSPNRGVQIYAGLGSLTVFGVTLLLSSLLHTRKGSGKNHNLFAPEFAHTLKQQEEFIMLLVQCKHLALPSSFLLGKVVSLLTGMKQNTLPLLKLSSVEHGRGKEAHVEVRQVIGRKSFWLPLATSKQRLKNLGSQALCP